MAQVKVKALKSWGKIKADDEFMLEEGQARRWAYKSRVKILGPAEESGAEDPDQRETKPSGPSETKPEGPSKEKGDEEDAPEVPEGASLEKVESGPGWYHVLVDGEPIKKPDGQPKNFREDDADAFIDTHG